MLARVSLLFLSFATCALPVAADEAAEERARELVQEAAALVKEQPPQYDQALSRLAEAQELTPRYPPVQSWLSHVYELMGAKDEALTHVAALLTLEADNEYGREAVKRLYLKPPFPRVLSRPAMAIAPMVGISFYDDECVLSESAVSPERLELALTTSVKYPEDAGEAGAVVERTLPAPQPDADPLTAYFNRVVYGYRELETGGLGLRVMAYYPSTLLSGSEVDLAPTAQALTHLMLRFHTYSEAYLGLPTPPDAEGITRLYLCTNGPSGAERRDSDIFLYRCLGGERSPTEWVRQLAHEAGHLLVPAIGGFAQPEMWANGEVGERLFLHFLAKEAAEFSGTIWPSQAAAARLDLVWPGGRLPVEDYFVASGRAPLGTWAAAGPDSEELLVGQDERAMQYYVGFVLHLLAAHGPEGLREVVTSCEGKTVADFIYTYKQRVAEWAAEGPLSIGAGAFDPTASKLSTPPPPASLAPKSLTLEPGDAVTYRVFLPTGTWRLRLESARGPLVELLTSFDGSDPELLALDSEPTLIGPLEEGWHQVSLTAPAGQAPAQLAGPVFFTNP